MSEFDNNDDVIETVEDAEVIGGSETVDTTQETYYESPDPNAGESGSKVFAIISLVCGILSIICCCSSWFGVICGVAAIVLGILSINKEEDAKGMAIAGIVCGGVGTLLGVVMIIISGIGTLADLTDYSDIVEQFEESL